MSFGRFLLSFADKVTTGAYSFVSFLVKMLLLELALFLYAAGSQSSVPLIFKSTLH